MSISREKQLGKTGMAQRGVACALAFLLGGVAPSGLAAEPGKGGREAQSIDDLFADKPPARAGKGKEPATLDDLFVEKRPAKAEKGKEPASIDDLFADKPPARADKAKEPASLDDLLADKPSGKPASPVAKPVSPIVEPALATTPSLSAKAPPEPGRAQITGFYQNDLAYTYAAPTHWSKFRNTLDLSATGGAKGGVAWKLGGRLSYDPIYDLTNYYPSVVRKDQRMEAAIREAYVDFSMSDWEFRLGRQHIIWGEMVGLFFADVVSAKDMRELVLRDFDMIRIPQWAARAEYFKGDFHGEAVWIPYMSFDDIGKPGAEFYPFSAPAGITARILSEDKPRGLRNSAIGGRLSYIKSGWDVSGFFYSANDPSAAFARMGPIGPVTDYRPVHRRINQWGATLGKDLGPMVLKAEAVYSAGKQMNVTNPADPDGLVRQNVLDYIVGLEWSFPEETRFNAQFYQRRIPDRDPTLVQNRTESGLSLMYSTQALHPRLEPKVLLIHSLDRRDWLAQFKLTWNMDGHWRWAFGADVFGGRGLMGQYDAKDRIYSELRYSF